MRGDHHGPGFHRRNLLRDPDAPGAQLGQDGFVVHQVAQHGQRLGGGLLQGQRDGVAHAKAHAQMFCSNDSHIILCITK